MALVPDRWVILRVRFEGPYVVLRVTDSEGGRVSFHAEWIAGPAPALGLSQLPLATHVAALAADLPPMRPGPHNTGPVPLAVFLDLPRFLSSASDWNRVSHEILQALLPSTGPDRIQLLTFAGRHRRLRTLFSLPFEVVGHGTDAKIDIETLSREWWTQAQTGRQRGITLTDSGETDSEGLESILRAGEKDVVITTDGEDAFAVCRELPLNRRPRLIVVKQARAGDPIAPPAGTAAVWLPPAPAPDPRVRELLFGFVHDLPIHEAVRAAERQFPTDPLWPVRVFADPHTNQSLRLRDALIRLHAEVERLELTLPSAGLEDFLARAQSNARGVERDQIERFQQRLDASRLGRGFGPAAGDAWSRAARSYDELTHIAEQAGRERDLPANFENFEQESSGLVPMTGTSGVLARLARDAVESAGGLQEIAGDADLRAIFENHQQRTVDIALQRLDTSPLFAPLSAHSTLAAGATYRLRVHVGNPRPDSLVVGPRPPIDPLLPEPDDEAGHLLEVVVQGKRFTVVSERTRPLRLPRFGGSAPVYFAIRAPRETGAASLRVHVYHRNHMVQTYLLEAEVGPVEQPDGPSEVLRVTLAYTRVRKLADAQGLLPRALSIGANRGPAGTHELILKGTSTSGELTLPPQTFAADVKRFRLTLAAASRDPTRPGAGRVYPPLGVGVAPPKYVADTIRGLARQGSELYAAFFRKAVRANPAMRKQLVRLQNGRDERIQVVRFDDNFIFPWALLYDFVFPLSIPGGPDPDVCLGAVRDAAGNTTPCNHTPDSKVVCANGFWSIRHYVEELIGRGVDADSTVTRPASNSVRVVCDATLPGTASFHTALQTAVAAPHLALGPSSESTLLDLLWKDPPARPSILIVVGHLETRPIAGEPDSPRIVLVPSAEWLTWKGLADRAQRTEGWLQPRPIVLLMACESATTSFETVNDFVTVLTTAGAAGVVGAEAVVPSTLAMDCATDLAAALWNRKTLGEAMTAFRRRTLAAGNPLAFLFHAVGTVDMALT